MELPRLVLGTIFSKQDLDEGCEELSIALPADLLHQDLVLHYQVGIAKVLHQRQ